MSLDSVTAIQLSQSTAQVSWQSEDLPVGGWAIVRFAVATADVLLAVVNVQEDTFTDHSLDELDDGAAVTYTIRNEDTLEELAASPFYIVDMDAPFTNAPPNPGATVPRYTSLDTLRRRLRIPAANTDFDEDLTEAIIGAEIALDYELGQSFPSTGTNPQYRTVPASVAMLATSAAIAVYKAGDAPFGTAGSDDMFGAVSIADVASQTIRRSPLIRGLQISFGISGGHA